MEENTKTNIEESMQANQKYALAMPIAVIIAGVLIAGAVIYSGGKNTNGNTVNAPQQQQVARDR